MLLGSAPGRASGQGGPQGTATRRAASLVPIGVLCQSFPL